MPATLAALARGARPVDAVRMWGDERVYATHTME